MSDRPDTGVATPAETDRVSAAQAASRLMTRLPVLLGIAAVMVGLAVFAWYHFAGRESTDNAQVEGHITPVAGRVGGTVAEVLIRENQAVKKGDVLVRIDSRDYDVALTRVRAELADAEAALAVAETSVPIARQTSSSDVQRTAGSVDSASAGATAAERDVEAARARLAAARARVVEAQANADRASKDDERLRGLVEKDEISRQQYDAAVAAATAARASVESARASAAEAETAVRVAESKSIQARGVITQAQAVERAARSGPDQVRVAEARAQAAAARVQQVRAAVQQAELNLQYTTIAAPSDGVVSRKAVEPGQIIQPGQPLLALVSLDDVWVVANFKETQLRDLRQGQRVSIAVDALDRTFEGRIDSIAAATGAKFSLLPAENASGNFVKVVQRVPVKIAIDRSDATRALRPGMSVVPTVYTR